MQLFWVWFAFIFVSWLLGLQLQGFQAVTTTQWFASACFWMLFFCAPLVRRRPLSLATLLIGCITMIWFMFLITTSSTYNHYALLLHLLIAGKATVRLVGPPLWTVLSIAGASTIVSVLAFTTAPPLLFVVCLVGITALALISYRGMYEKSLLLHEQHSALLTEYRRIKRNEADAQVEARHEERARIAEELHDSLGHKLTSLMMQLEVLRIQSSKEDDRHKLHQLKILAEESLAETRQAVTVMHEADTQGIPAVIDLIRKLEAETHVQVTFHIEQGVLVLKLTNEQSVTLYRAIQEGMTNALKHGNKRQVSIRLKAPSGMIIRFELQNSVKGNKAIQAGFGLQSMQKRVEKLGGSLQFMQAGSSFYLQGSIPLEGGARHDSNLISGGSSNGSSRVKNDD